MIRIANAQLWVYAQDEALSLLHPKPGWEVRAEVTMQAWNLRWLMVGPAGKDGNGLLFMPVTGPPPTRRRWQHGARRACG
jgi:hypothetical protein